MDSDEDEQYSPPSEGEDYEEEKDSPEDEAESEEDPKPKKKKASTKKEPKKKETKKKEPKKRETKKKEPKTKEVKPKEPKEKKSKKNEPASEDEEDDGPNPYFYPKYTKAHKQEFKDKFIELLGSIEGTVVEQDKRSQIKDLVYQYEMHKRPQALDEVFETVQEYFTTGGKAEGDKLENLTLMGSVYQALMSSVMQPKPLIEEAMFFPSKKSEKRLAKIISKAEKTLEICVFAFTNNILAEAVLGRHKAGVQVRIITDDECSKFFGADIWGLVLEGVQVSMDDHKRFHMHNKFVVIDDLVLATGSFNWTSQAVTGNQENLCVIDNETFVKEYKAEFERLWTQFEPNRITVEMANKHLEDEEAEKKRRVEKAKETKKNKELAKAKKAKDE